MRVVIVGNGVAGMEAALRLHSRDERLHVTLVSEESDHFFSRTALMWVHAGQLRHEDIEPLPRDIYHRLGFARVRARAIGIDVDRRRLRLAGNLPSIPYDRLLLACGSRPRPARFPGAELRGVGHFVTLQDLAWYETELWGRTSRPEPPRPRAHLTATTADSPYLFREAAAEGNGAAARAPAVIGGGLIAIEAVELALARGLRPQLFMRDGRCWPVALCQREAEFVATRLRAHGVAVHPECEVRGLVGDAQGRVAGVRTARTMVACDVVVVAIGVVPNTQWLLDTPLRRTPEGGIWVDERLRTSVPDVFAAGDCAAVPGPQGEPRVEPLWYSARDQGRVAADAIAGVDVAYRSKIPYNSAKLIDLEYTSVGVLQPPDGGDEWVFEEQGTVHSTLRVVLGGAQVIGFSCLGRRYDHSVLRRFIHQRRTLPWVLDHLHEAAFDTEFVPPLRIPKAARPA